MMHQVASSLKCGRRPLQPKNSQPLPSATLKPKLQNPPPLADSSLADELFSIKKKLHRLRLDGRRTEKMLRHRDMVLELHLNELLRRDLLQRDLEIELDWLFRLNQLRAYSLTISPIRSLREKERLKIINQPQFPDIEVGDGEESVGENSCIVQNLSCDSPESAADM